MANDNASGAQIGESGLLRGLDKAKVILLFAVLILHPTDFAFDLGGDKGVSQRHVFHAFGMMGKASAAAKAPHLYVTLADVLIGAAFGVYLLRRVLRKQWRDVLRVPLPVALLVVWFGLSALSMLKPNGGRGIESGGKGFIKELIQLFEYLVVAYLVFEEAFRVLKPGGRLMISDIVLLKELPDFIKNSVAAYVGCISGAVMKDEYLEVIRETGFHEVKIIDETSFPTECIVNDPTAKTIIDEMNLPVEEIKDTANSVASIKVQGMKPE